MCDVLGADAAWTDLDGRQVAPAAAVVQSPGHAEVAAEQCP